MSEENELKQLWQQADAFQRQIGLRNRIEYIASVLVMAVFSA